MKTKAGKDTYPIPGNVHDIESVWVEGRRIPRVPQVDVMAAPRQRGVPQIFCLNRNTSTISIWPIPHKPMRLEVYYLMLYKA